MTKKTLAAMAVASAMLVGADAQLNTAYDATIIRLIDSDTYEVKMELFPAMGISSVVKVRSLGIDTPEKFRPDKKCFDHGTGEKALALEATSYVASIIPHGDDVRITNVGLGKYAGRVVALVWDDEIDGLGTDKPDGEWFSLSQLLLDEGYAVEYWGKTKKTWCGDWQRRHALDLVGQMLERDHD